MGTSSRNRGLALVYAATIFVSAFLLFQIQPMISKAILPWFGGTPAVWTICLLFFQSLLFAGYAYAHFTNHWLRPWKQAVLHILVIIAALALLHVLPTASEQPSGDTDPTRAILTILLITIGLPYFVLSATGPLLQAWFTHSFPGRIPYRLYALSNVGSLLALLSYPFLFERQLDLTWQTRLWSAGFIAFAFLCAFAAWRVWRMDANDSVPVGQAVPDSPRHRRGLAHLAESSEQNVPVPLSDMTKPSLSHYLLWLLLPAFGSLVLIATTNHISTDVAVVPLLWVVPLALYLLTFIIAFDRPVWYWPILTAIFTLVAIYPTSAIYKNNNVGWLKLYDCGMTGRCVHMAADLVHNLTNDDADDSAPNASTGPQVHIGFRTALLVNFAAMFGICMLCHGQLARLKPLTRYLTAYYLMIAAGGAIGGIAVSIVAPHVFKTILEWSISIFVAAIAAIGVILSAVVNRAVDPDLKWDPEAAGDHPLLRSPRSKRGLSPSGSPSRFWARLLLAGIVVPIAFYMLDMTEFLFSQHKNAVYQSRNFFGALTIRDENPTIPATRQLMLLNGTTLHGSQFTLPERRGQPTSYYGPKSGVGLVIGYFRANRPPGGIRIGDVGLGAGTLAAYAMKFDHITFYEINPTVIDISTSGKWFTFVSDARARGAHCDIILGDARLSLQRELSAMPTARRGHADRDNSLAAPSAGHRTLGSSSLQASIGDHKLLPYHILVLDAFSGDAVPTHLLTREAMNIYLPHLANEANMGVDGALLIHVSNRYLDLERVARGAADYIGFHAIKIASGEDEAQSVNSADWIVLTRNRALLAYLKPYATKPSSADKPPVLWTDAHSSLFEILR
ncbi:MAG TPA: hypothetical protein VFW73_01120 [Lacipirellulaceae bacterium]|nr:hypothetical protein [Lacipirellulaceae bacterium]